MTLAVEIKIIVMPITFAELTLNLIYALSLITTY